MTRRRMAQLAMTMQTKAIKRAILVVEEDISPYAKRCLNEVQPHCHIEVFKE
jgi:hypothetical protein